LTGEAGKEVLIPLTEMFRRFHINGRTGPVVYALSAIEIALWDIAGKACVVADRIVSGGRAARADRLREPAALRGTRVGRICYRKHFRLS
jgi:L-alanine-DL-glutamate epimerase-like enolase superfamily enzyme